MESSENSHGFTIKTASDGTRIVLECPHQGGVLYSIPAEATWVCESALLPSHALAGFLTELTAMSDDRINTMLQRWGIYFRPSKPSEN
tara:strand:- start:240 stop:503 length:264 start_codon:yes stop_codon:yes gene_type:complete